MLVVVLGVLFEPPAPARADLRVLRQAAQRLLGDLLRHALYRIVRRGHGGAELGTAAHLREIRVELLHLRNHRLRYLEALARDVKAVPHGAPPGVVPLFDAEVVPDPRLAALR